jgi:Glycosyl hydrolase family 36 N-terminal domain
VNPGSEPVEAESLSFATLNLPNGTTELTSLTGFWACEFTTQREVLPIGSRVLESRTVQTGHKANPFFLSSLLRSHA